MHKASVQAPTVQGREGLLWVWEDVRENCLCESCIPSKKNTSGKGKEGSQSLHSAAVSITNWDVAQLVECLPSIQKVLGLIPQYLTNEVVLCLTVFRN